MTCIGIKLEDMKSVSKLVNILNKYDVTADLESGRRIVDARSLLGILSLDLSSPVNLRIINVSEELGSRATTELESLHS